MKNLASLLLLAFLFALFPLVAYADQPGSPIGNIIDFLSLASGGCGGAAQSGNCSDDPNSGLFSSIACRVMKAFNTGVIPIYCRIVSNPDYLGAVNAAMTLYVIFLGVSFLFGIVPMKANQLVSKILRAAFVYAFVINADLYFSIVYNTVLKTPQDMVRIMLTADGSNARDFFQYVDEGMYKIFTSLVDPTATPGSGTTLKRTDLKIFALGLGLWQFGGDLVGGLFFAVVVGWIGAYFSIMIRYLLALLSMMFVLMLGPIFLPMLLFDRLKEMGQEWIRLLICFIAQIVLVVAFVLMMQGFFLELYDQIKQGLESTVFKQSQQKSLVTANSDSAYAISKSSSTTNLFPFRADSFITNIKTGISNEDAKKMAEEAGIPRDKIPEFVFHLIVTLAIVMASLMFIKQVPTLAVLLIGNPRFIRIFSGGNFSSTGGGDRFQAKMPWQKSGGGTEDLRSTGYEGGFGRA